MSKVKRFALLLLLAALAAAAFGIAKRARTTEALRAVAAEAAIPTVSIVAPQAAQDAESLVLPGEIEALNTASIYAQTSGYIRAWSADIGDKVAQGQLLAELDAPELEHQLAQAKADYATAQAERKTAQTIATRARKLLAVQAISQEDADKQTGDADARSAAADAALSNVGRIEAQKAFTRLVAPFDGVITSRSAQIGDLVVAGTSGAKPLFTIADARRVRIHVRVPQNDAAQIGPGLEAVMTVPDRPDARFKASVTRSAGAVDAESGSMLVELEADNQDGQLLPGAYAQVAFQLKAAAGSLFVPGSALLYRDDKPALIVVGKDNHVTIKTVTIGRDQGKVVEITSGIAADDRIADTPPDAIADGDEVRIKEADKKD